jgi:hypothetical protein
VQSLTLPLQGFLNTIVYGWSRKDFLDSMALFTPQNLQDHHSDQVDVVEEDHKSSRRPSSLLQSRGGTHSSDHTQVADLIQTTDDGNMTDTDAF